MDNTELFRKAADSIRDSLPQVNKLLEACEMKSEVVDQENKIVNFLSLNVDELIEDKPKDDFYDLDQITKIFEMLETSKQDGKKKLRNMRSESSSSLLSLTSNQSIEDITQNQDYYMNEISSHIAGIESTLKSIHNFTIESPNLKSVKDKEASRMLNFSENMMNLQKLAKELNNIAASDRTENDDTAFTIDEKLVNDMKQISQTLADINESSKDPLANLHKQDLCSFELTAVINEILNAIEQNYSK